MSAEPRLENALPASIILDEEDGFSHRPGSCRDALSSEAESAYVEPGGMVEIALRELGARLVRVTQHEPPPSQAADQSLDGILDPPPDSPVPS